MRMANVRFKVTAKTFDGMEFIVERFPERQAAEDYLNRLETDDILSDIPAKSVILTMEEMYEGEWIVLQRRTVTV